MSSSNTTRNTTSNNNSNNNIGHILGNRLNNNLNNDSGNSNIVWFTTIIPLLIICSFAVAFRITAKSFSFCNIGDDICGIAHIHIDTEPESNNNNSNKNNNKTDSFINSINSIHVDNFTNNASSTSSTTTKSESEDTKDDNKITPEEQEANILKKEMVKFMVSVNSDKESIVKKLMVTCKENTDTKQNQLKTKPGPTIVVMWILFALSIIVTIGVFIVEGGSIPSILTTTIPITFLGLAIDATVNKNVGRSVMAIIITTAIIFGIIAIISAVSDMYSYGVTLGCATIAITLVGIVAANHKLFMKGEVEYALTKTMTLLMFIINILYTLILLTILILMGLNIGFIETFKSEYSALLILLCMISQIGVYGRYLSECMQKKYECIPAITLLKDTIKKPDNKPNKDASRFGDFIAKCNVMGLSKMNVDKSTMILSVFAVILLVISGPHVLVTILQLDGFGNKMAAAITILICIILAFVALLK